MPVEPWGMGRKVRSRFVLLVGTAMAVALSGSVAGHEGDDDPGKVHACVRKKGGRMRVVASDAEAKCRKKEKPLHFSVTGPPGPAAWERPCPADAVGVGVGCIDRYEGSVWSIPAGDAALLAAVREGTATLADLTAGGAVQHGAATLLSCTGTEYPATFPVTGAWTEPLYAASVAGVRPSHCLSWFQAQQACALSGKRLVTNDAWQEAAAGTPDPGMADDGATTCATASAGSVETGSRAACVSRWGAFDMVGNVYEWVGGRWGIGNTGACPTWPAAFGGDDDCLTIPPGGVFLNVLARGGSWFSGTLAGPFAVQSTLATAGYGAIGFRCAR